MRFVPETFRFVLAGAAAILTVALVSSTADAGDGRYRDKVYADSYGNLVIHSAAGYKRIIVGEGHLAGKLAEYTGSEDADVVYYDEDDGRAYVKRCRRATLLKGRSYMYGLPDGVVPEPACD